MKSPVRYWQVCQQRPIEYVVRKTPRLFDHTNPTLLEHGRIAGGRRFVVVDANVARLHGDAIGHYFEQRQIEARVVTFAGGEEHKNLATLQQLAQALDAFPIHRRDEPIIAVGGGVLTDVVGFLASSYRRGLPHVKVPTTLMGYIDAALGIKTGINFNGQKNRLGSFEPPLAVYLDQSLLHSLPIRHVHNGVCEIIKLAIVRDGALFELLEREGAAAISSCFASDAGEAMLDLAIGGMLDELAPNLFEQELARRVDFGHTFSYGLEAKHEQRLLHGEAVLLDILVSTLIAQTRGLLSTRDAGRIFMLVPTLGIELDYAVLDAALMWQALLDRVEHRNGMQRVPVPCGIGDCVFLNDITRREIESSVQALHDWSKVPHAAIRQR